MNASSLPKEEVLKIGFNDTVRVEQRVFHVQTEVLSRDAITIRTTVLESGVVKHAENRPCPKDTREIGALRALVEAQHRHYLGEISRMGAPWLASI